MDIGPVDRNKGVPERLPADSEPNRKDSIRRHKRRDRLQISEESRRIQTDAVEKRSNSEQFQALRNEKLKAVKRRIDDGFYGRSEIKGKLADLLSENNILLGPLEVENDPAESEETDSENLLEILNEENTDIDQNQSPPILGT